MHHLSNTYLNTVKYSLSELEIFSMGHDFLKLNEF